MIILQKGGKAYRCPGAFFTDLNDRRQADVTSKADVLAFLQKHPDEQFLLVADGEPTQEVAPGDADGAVCCGLVKWDTTKGGLQSKPLS
jgi:hypothetical protein